MLYCLRLDLALLARDLQYFTEKKKLVQGSGSGSLLVLGSATKYAQNISNCS